MNEITRDDLKTYFAGRQDEHFYYEAINQLTDEEMVYLTEQIKIALKEPMKEVTLVQLMKMISYNYNKTRWSDDDE